jgi:xylan 1,4-beta-xylosidase
MRSSTKWLTFLSLAGLTVGALSQERPAAPAAQQSTVAILNGDFPDPSIVRDGDDFYMTNSTYDYVPGMLIWHSKDLRHWTPITRALRRQLGAIWAPDFVHYNGLFYIYFPSKGTNWVITAKSPYGPWSEPIDLKVRGIDPGHIATPEGKRYLYVDAGRAIELAPDGLSTAGTLRKVYDGWTYPADWAVQCFCSESPKLIFHGGYYYLLTAQGGTSGPTTSHMGVIARSRNPLGPWENSPLNPLIHTANAKEPWWSTGHATLIDDSRGQWYAVYHGYENGHRNMGRHVLLSPVEWTPEGWLKPLQPMAQGAAPVIIPNHQIQSEDFSKPELNLEWQFSGIASRDDYEIKDGAVTFQAEADKLKVLHTQAANHNYEATVEVDAASGAEAGLILFYGPAAYVGIGVNAGRVVNLQMARNAGRPVECADCRFLKLRLVDDDLSTFYSTDGVNWKKTEASIDVSAYQTNALGNFSSIRLGIYGKGSGQVKIQKFTYQARRLP